jgi:hypothetical protein
MLKGVFDGGEGEEPAADGGVVDVGHVGKVCELGRRGGLSGHFRLKMEVWVAEEVTWKSSAQPS